MSDTLADLASWLPSDFLTADDLPFMDNRTRNVHNPLLFPSEFPYEFASCSSTESESDDDDLAGLTRRFTRSASLQERLKIPYPIEKKRVFSGSPDSALGLAVSGPTQFRSSRISPFLQTDEDAWDLIYAAAGQVARLKMRMNNISNINNINDNFVANTNNRGLLGAPRPLGPPLSHHHHHPRCTIWRSEREELIRQQQFGHRVAGYGGDGGRPMCLPLSAWSPLPVENQRRQQPCNGFGVKPVLGGSGGRCGRGTDIVKRECAGTGVFLPRRYCNDPPESKKKPACSPAHLPARVAQSFNKNVDPIPAQAQPNIHGRYVPHYETLVARRNAMILAQQRRSTTHVGLPEPAMGHPEVVLPQEWTY